MSFLKKLIAKIKIGSMDLFNMNVTMILISLHKFQFILIKININFKLFQFIFN
jgi:hypothetical protein